MRAGEARNALKTMQFVPRGPDLPEPLLAAHEEGQVVFFCGAGISRPAGLGDFHRLTCQLFRRLGVLPTPAQASAIREKRFDQAINLLEGDYVGGRLKVRRKLAELLQPDLKRPRATTTHQALLTLARTRTGQTRLVTTNFDRLFEVVIRDKGLDGEVERFHAPTIPLPKAHWNGLVYLHGRLPDPAEPETRQESALDRLVLSSGDFGLAYLIEGWAARFVSELFRRYVVCFVGYSLNDPILRYMTDALAADRQRGENLPEVFAFAGCKPSGKRQEQEKWKGLGISPLVYEVRDPDHSVLHDTLREWAEQYRDGITGKTAIITREATTPPRINSPEACRVCWAVSDRSGDPARHFAVLNPIPPLEWLEVFDPLDAAPFSKDDLPRFGVSDPSWDSPPRKQNNGEEQNRELRFTLLRRPTPSSKAPWMALVHDSHAHVQWDPVMGHLADWLLRHLNNPQLLVWLAERGGQLHPEFSRRIQNRLDQIAAWEKAGQQTELDRLKEGAPDAIPSPRLRWFWHLMLAGRITGSASRGSWASMKIYHWKNSFEQAGLTSGLRLRLFDLLRPRIELRKAYDFEVEFGLTLPDLPLVAEVTLCCGEGTEVFAELSVQPAWQQALPELFLDFNRLLREAVELLAELWQEPADRSHSYRPSLLDTPVDYSESWTLLIDLTRDAWLALEDRDRAKALAAARVWWQEPFPVFKRLSLFAAAHRDGEGFLVPAPLALEWLLAEDARWLWDRATEREVVHLLRERGRCFSPAERALLEDTLLQGPAKAATPDWLVYLRLHGLAFSGVPLGENARLRLECLEQQHPDHVREAGKYRTGGLIQVSPTVKIGGEEPTISSPRRRRELVAFLKAHPSMFAGGDRTQHDDWPQRCARHFPTTACALFALARENVWPTERWAQALSVWYPDASRAAKAWRRLAPTVVAMPEKELQELAHPVASWLLKVSENLRHHEPEFFTLIRRIPSLWLEWQTPPGDLVNPAINHPLGMVAEALLVWLKGRSPAPGMGLPTEVRDFFTPLCDAGKPAFQPARIVLASRLNFLFWLDEDWTTRHLLPLFDWTGQPAEARGAWQGFLGFLRTSDLSRPLPGQIKLQFLATARHYHELGRWGESYARLLTEMSLEARQAFQESELAGATHALPPAAREKMVRWLVELLKSTGNQRAEYFRNRVLPYMQSSIWPKAGKDFTPNIRESLSRLFVASGEAFPEALDEFKEWLEPLKYWGVVTLALEKSGLCGCFPAAALDFLARVVDEQQHLPGDALKSCLDQIAQELPDLARDPRYLRLKRLAADR